MAPTGEQRCLGHSSRESRSERFVEATRLRARCATSAGAGDGRRYIGWFLRTMGRVAKVSRERSAPIAGRSWTIPRIRSARENSPARDHGEAAPIYEDWCAGARHEPFRVSSMLRSMPSRGLGCRRPIAGAGREASVSRVQACCRFTDAKRDPDARRTSGWAASLESAMLKRGVGDISAWCMPAIWAWSRNLRGPRPLAWAGLNQRHIMGRGTARR